MFYLARICMWLCRIDWIKVLDKTEKFEFRFVFRFAKTFGWVNGEIVTNVPRLLKGFLHKD
jgi:hypothetical protein